MSYPQSSVKMLKDKQRMKATLAILAAALFAFPVFGAAPPKIKAPSLRSVRATMGIPSTSLALRGQRDAVGYASTAAQMAEVWKASTSPPLPMVLGKAVNAPVAGILCPHDDYVYAGRVYRKLVPLVKAETVVVIGVFHAWQRFGARNVLIFDRYKAWRSPDGPIVVSNLREDLIKRSPKAERIQNTAMQDEEHSVEAIVYWLKHVDPAVQIVPILVPEMNFARMRKLAADLGDALKGSMAVRSWKVGRDVDVVISSDAVHYGPDFDYTPYGPGGVSAYTKATAQDLRLLKGPLEGRLTTGKARLIFGALCDAANPEKYRITWCGRFSVPFGMLLLNQLADIREVPLAYATSVGWPELKM